LLPSHDTTAKDHESIVDGEIFSPTIDEHGMMGVRRRGARLARAASDPRLDGRYCGSLGCVRGLPAQAEVTVARVHFLQEDSPDEIGRAIAGWMGALG
jgi:hypothetical protein